jgi:hypothetical protein
VSFRCLPRTWLFAVVTATTLGATFPAPAEQGGSLAEVDALVQAGAPSLALAVVERHQPFFLFDAVAWEQWERRRLRLYADGNQWSSLLARLSQHPGTTREPLRRFALELGAEAHLALGDGDGARDAYARLIWGRAGEAPAAAGDDLARWRAGLAHGYLLAKHPEDAHAATLRYRLDYGEDAPGWRLAYAEALVRSGSDTEARELLAGLDHPRADFLRLLLLARDPGMDPDTLLLEAAASLDDGSLDADLRAQLWAALAQVAARYRDHEVRVTAMEQALALGPVGNRTEGFVTIDGDQLWDAYDDHAGVLANQAHLLVGRFDSWLALADQQAVSDPLKARALYAHLSREGRAPDIAERARRGLLVMLAGEPRGLNILGGLYLDSRRYGRPESIPAAARAPLLAVAEGESRRALAEGLAGEFTSEDGDAVPAPWRAPVALALIAEGRAAQAAALVAGDLSPGGATRVPDGDSALGVGLALVGAGEAKAARALLARALATPGRTEDPGLLYALALANRGIDDHREAARLFLHSAGAGGGSGGDAWAALMALEAARSLTEAGLERDAEGVLAGALGGEGSAVVEHLLARP